MIAAYVAADTGPATAAARLRACLVWLLARSPALFYFSRSAGGTDSVAERVHLPAAGIGLSDCATAERPNGDTSPLFDGITLVPRG